MASRRREGTRATLAALGYDREAVAKLGVGRSDAVARSRILT